MAKTYLEVQKQIQQLQKEADALRKKEAAGVLERIKEAIVIYGFTASDLGVDTGGAKTPKGRKVKSTVSRPKAKPGSAVPKYKDDQGNVWGGRGPRPAWFKAALESGKTAEELTA
ncbi:DNA-binding protein H-NS [Variovorax boronicumulans]|uniref:H-NS histone family protein n=1 Tax=Variovorax boronicumulans TaxID=436515 RepID=UPI00247370F9|nr:H-NS histone family protein [Variovorax boronicumulans]MDH6164914.1 DNA-binding protein H-NS [Variovorax boronicumulans]